MANRYWVYNGGDINDTTHWSATSGGAGGASKPTLADNVIFDANSFTLSSQVVTLNEAFNCLSMDWAGLSKTVTLSSYVFSLNLYGNLTLATGLTWTFTGTAYLNHKASGTVMTNGVTLNANRVYFDAAGITVMNGDAANYGSASFYLTNGTWNTNGKTITSTGSFNTVAGTKTLTLGASIFNIGTWTNTVPTGFTFNANTSTVVITTASILTGITTFYNLTCSGVTTLNLANNITVTNALTLAGSSVSNRLKILSSVAGTSRTVTVPAAGVFPSNLDVQDIAFPNAVDMSAIFGYSQDFGNNTGITFTASANLYFKHSSGAANWGDITKWVLADRVTQGRIPLIQDDVNFDNLSFTGTSILTVNQVATCRSMNWTGLNQAVTLSSAVNSLSVYGYTTLATGLTWAFTGAAYTYMKAPEARNIITNGIIAGFNRLYFDRIGGVWTNQDNFNVGSSYIGLTNGTWNTNSKTITTTGDFEPQVGIKTLTLGASVFNCGTFNIYFYASVINLINIDFTFNCGTSLIRCDYFYGSTFNQPYYDVYAYKGYNQSNSQTYRNLSVVPITAINVLFKIANHSVPAPTTVTVTNMLTVKGFSTYNRAFITPNYSYQYPCTINAANVSFENVDFRDIIAGGTANWNLSSIPGGSGDCLRNSGIVFTPNQTQYYKHTSGACSWSDASKWVTSSGGTNPGRIPLPQDDVIFDALSFTGNSSMSGIGGSICKTLNMSTVNVTLTVPSNIAFNILGGFILGANVAISCSPTFLGEGTNYINTYGVKLIDVIFMSSGTFVLTGDFYCRSYIVGGGHTFLANGFNVTVSYFQYHSGGSMYAGSGIWTMKGTIYTQFSIRSNQWYPENGTLIFAYDNEAITDVKAELPDNINKVIIKGTLPNTYILSGNCTIADLTIEANAKIKFTAGQTINIGKLTAIGTQANPITIGSVTEATHILNKIGPDVVEVEYCNISNSDARPSDKWSAGETSVDGGGNSGWTFKFIPIVMLFFGIFSKK